MYVQFNCSIYILIFLCRDRAGAGRGGGLKGKGRSSNPGVRFAGFNYILRLLLSLVSLGLQLRAYKFGSCAK